MSYERTRLLLAYGIASWDSALAHLYALRQVGERVPWGVTGRMEAELRDLVTEWQVLDGTLAAEPDNVARERVVAEARAYVTQHGDDLERYRVNE